MLGGARTLLRWSTRHGLASLAVTLTAGRGDPQACFFRDPATLADPYPFYRRLRELGPLVAGPLVWGTARHPVAAEVLCSDALVVGARNSGGPRLLGHLRRLGEPGAPVGPADPPSMLAVDPPEHSRYRRLVTRVFTRRAIEALAPGIERHCAELLERLSGRVDLVGSYAYQLPLTVIAEILGVPAGMRRQLLEWGRAMTPALDLGIPLGTFRRTEQAIRSSNAWMLGHFARLRRDPGDDLLSQLVRLEIDGERLTDRELLATAGLVLGAGFETTAGLLGTGTELLIRHPGQLEVLRAGPDQWANAVEEILRYDTPVQNTARVCAAATEIAGVALRPGTMVVTYLGGANRDPEVFADPDRFDVTRVNAREHLAFSAGRHHCLGAALARLEGRIALRALFERFPGLALDGAPRRRSTRVLRGYDALPVRLSAPDPVGAPDPAGGPAPVSGRVPAGVADQAGGRDPVDLPDAVAGRASADDAQPSGGPAVGPAPVGRPGGAAPVLFASPAHPGQLNPLLVLAAELSWRRVPGLWFAAEEQARASVEACAIASPVRFESTGDTRLRMTGELYAAMTRGPMTTDGIVALARVLRERSVTEPVYRATLEQVERIRPGLMVIDVLNIGALDAALIAGVPFVVSVPSPVSGVYLGRLPWGYPTPMSGLPRRLSTAQKAANAAFRLRMQVALVAALLAGPARHRRAAGLPNLLADPQRYCAAARAVLGYSVFGLEYPFPAPSNVHMVGAMVPSRHVVAAAGAAGAEQSEPARSELARSELARSELAGWLAGRPRVIYVGLGTLVRLAPPQLLALYSALNAMGPRCGVLWKLDDDQRALLPAALPEHLRIESWIPSQLEVLAHPHTRVFVCHGGANGLHEGLYFGQPMLLLPLWMDCHDATARALDAGVGLSLDRPMRIDADEVAAKLHRLLTEEGFRERAGYWGRRLRGAGGPARAADLIERLVGEAGPRPAPG